MNKIKLNFINLSNDANNSSIVIYQKNVCDSQNQNPVAWKVIENCGNSENHPFTYSMDYEISSGDSYGNYTPQLKASSGSLFSVSNTSSGETMQVNGNANSPYEIEFRNDLSVGSVSANIYRDEKLLAVERNIAPGQKVAFQFKPTIWVGVVSQIEEGEIMNSAILNEINTELNLMGIASADIIMTGGGPGSNAIPFTFTLSNIQMA